VHAKGEAADVLGMPSVAGPHEAVGAAAYDVTHLRQEVEKYRWFHTIDLGHGVVTPGEVDTAKALRRLRLPERLDGLSVLDIGAWDGFYSFEAERRGASRVVAVDPECWRDPSWGPRGWGTKKPFELAHRALASRVDDADVDLDKISPDTVGSFDVVFFLGVFYHLPDPWRYLRAASSVCTHLLVVETHADLLEMQRPAMAFYPGDEVSGDPSNWWGPNKAAIVAMLGETGFSRVVVYSERRLYRFARTTARRVRGERFRFQQGRLVAHAYR
jgi:tRNA (mo5U34)-methyltransferase